MIRPLLALLGLVLLTAAAPTPDWSAVTTRLPSGAMLTGNPQARVKLVEYASYTCSHCADFSVASTPVLKGRLIRSGSTSLEFRHLIRDALDLSAAVVARCGGSAAFAGTSEAIFAAQSTWLPRGAEWQEANARRLALLTPAAQLRALADGAGLTAIGKARGLTEARVAQCFADAGEIERIVALTRAAPPDVTSTPAFFVNGRRAANVDWPRLEPMLRAAGAR